VALAVNCSGAVMLTAVFLFLTRKKNLPKLVYALGVLQLSFVIGLILFYTLGYHIQATIALPHIQQALDEHCTGENIEAAADGFYIESRFRWESGDKLAECYYGGVDWICSCVP
jgi:hypothetical protein